MNRLPKYVEHDRGHQRSLLLYDGLTPLPYLTLTQSQALQAGRSMLLHSTPSRQELAVAVLLMSFGAFGAFSDANLPTNMAWTEPVVCLNGSFDKVVLQGYSDKKRAYWSLDCHYMFTGYDVDHGHKAPARRLITVVHPAVPAEVRSLIKNPIREALEGWIQEYEP